MSDEVIDILMGIALISFAGYYFYKKNQKPALKRKNWDVRNIPQKFVFSPIEKAFSSPFMMFANKLLEATHFSHRVFFCVRLSEIVHVAQPEWNHPMSSVYQTLANQDIDFLLCDAGFEIKAIVFFDDGRDVPTSIIHELCDKANIPVITFRSQTEYSVLDIKRKLYGESVFEIF